MSALPDSSYLLEKLRIELPLIGFYDAPDADVFKPVVKPKAGDCVFAHYKSWLKGETLRITRDEFGCGGAGNCFWQIQFRSREGFLKFLVEEEGLKASADLMERSMVLRRRYQADHDTLFIGPLKPEAWLYLKTLTFFVDPDQLSALMIGAQYHAGPDDPVPVLAPFGSGCRELIPFPDFDVPQASIGATDLAMRQHIPPDILAFTVTKPMFARLCSLDDRSFLGKAFLARLKKARGGKL
jgi:hypothetical protein